MSGEPEFVDGLIVRAPRDGAPAFLKCALSIKREALIAWLQGRDGEWVNLDVKESRGGKWYAAVNNWKPSTRTADSREPEPTSQDEPLNDDVPF